MKLNQKTKDLLSLLLRVALSVGFLVFLFRKIDIGAIWAALKSADPWYIFLGGVAFFLINILLLGRWYIFIKALQLHVPIKSVVRYFFIGLFGNLFLPTAVGGDLIKIWGLCTHTDQKAKVVASVLLDRLIGFASIVTVATVSFIIGFRMINDMTLLFSIAVLGGLSVVVGVVLFNERIYSFCCQIFSAFPKIRQSLMKLHYDIVLLKDKKIALFHGLWISCLGQFFLAITFYFVAKALGQDIRFIYFMIFVPLLCVASSLPSIGGLGVREAGAVYLFGKIGVSGEVAIAISLIDFLYMVIVGLLGGVIYVATLSSGRVQHHPAAADPSPKRV